MDYKKSKTKSLNDMIKNKNEYQKYKFTIYNNIFH